MLSTRTGPSEVVRTLRAPPVEALVGAAGAPEFAVVLPHAEATRRAAEAPRKRRVKVDLDMMTSQLDLLGITYGAAGRFIENG